LWAAFFKRRRRPTRHCTGFPEGAATSSRWSQHAAPAGYHRRRWPASSHGGTSRTEGPPTTAGGGDLPARRRPRRRPVSSGSSSPAASRGCACAALTDRPGLPACGGRRRRSGLPVGT
jgi:hypothetical protein